jgi:hypothetical protein
MNEMNISRVRMNEVKFPDAFDRRILRMPASRLQISRRALGFRKRRAGIA